MELRMRIGTNHAKATASSVLRLERWALATSWCHTCETVMKWTPSFVAHSRWRFWICTTRSDNASTKFSPSGRQSFSSMESVRIVGPRSSSKSPPQTMQGVSRPSVQNWPRRSCREMCRMSPPISIRSVSTVKKPASRRNWSAGFKAESELSKNPVQSSDDISMTSTWSDSLSRPSSLPLLGCLCISDIWRAIETNGWIFDRCFPGYHKREYRHSNLIGDRWTGRAIWVMSGWAMLGSRT